MPDLPIVVLRNCPNPKVVPWYDRWSGDHLIEVCACPYDAPSAWRVHWNDQDGTPRYCPCGPREGAPGDGMYWGVSAGAYACRDCLRALPSGLVMRGLACDMRCCFCDGVAREFGGAALHAHGLLRS
ncbi:hypothetical protein [Kitasatospora mediocidica]|uniref:hypothetical protein n=1 Tax=Kitasatospora mediocidica TaxID=58352 RepID=UPI00056B05C3|nr:hypothetical protein [Kitasatospora mediocidica]